jgi:hypothetical protein
MRNYLVIPSARKRIEGYYFEIKKSFDFALRAALRMTLTMALMGIALPAHAERIRDMSLSPEESMRLPDIDYGTSGSPYGSSGSDRSFGGTGGGGRSALPRGRLPMASGESDFELRASRFMDSYCSQEAAMGIGMGGDLQQCLQKTKGEVCRDFAQLPSDARRVLDRAVDCEHALSEMGSHGAALDCAAEDRARLFLLKKYWNDSNAAQALVFLPDRVLRAGEICVGAR